MLYCIWENIKGYTTARPKFDTGGVRGSKPAGSAAYARLSAKARLQVPIGAKCVVALTQAYRLYGLYRGIAKHQQLSLLGRRHISALGW